MRDDTVQSVMYPLCGLLGIPKPFLKGGMLMTNKKYERSGKRKEIVFRDNDWSIIERKAAAVKLDTTKYITRAAVHGTAKAVDFKELSRLSCELNKIGNNINQLARKANEINSIYAEDYRQMREEFLQLCRTLNQGISELLRFAA